MKKKKNKVKQITKIKHKKTNINERTNNKTTKLKKILSSKFQTLVNTYVDYREKRKIEKLKEKQKKLKEEEEIKLETKERRLKNAEKLKKERK